MALDLLDCEADEAVFVGGNYEADYVGPIGVGMSAFLIDPAAHQSIPAQHRLSTVLEIEEALAADVW